MNRFVRFCIFILGWPFTFLIAKRDQMYSQMPGSTFGSKARNMLSLVAAVWTVCVLLEIIVAEATGLSPLRGTLANRALALFWVLMAIAIFTTTVLAAIRLHGRRYQIAAGRLLRDVTISACLTIVSFAWYYRFIGLHSGGGIPNAQCFFTSGSHCTCDAGALDSLYFSIVTFSTLGFGDFTACTNKIVSALQALLGNLHLGIFVGAVFYFLSESGSEKDHLNTQGHDSREDADNKG